MHILVLLALNIQNYILVSVRFRKYLQIYLYLPLVSSTTIDDLTTTWSN